MRWVVCCVVRLLLNFLISAPSKAFFLCTKRLPTIRGAAAKQHKSKSMMSAARALNPSSAAAARRASSASSRDGVRSYRASAVRASSGSSLRHSSKSAKKSKDTFTGAKKKKTSYVTIADTAPVSDTAAATAPATAPSSPPGLFSADAMVGLYYTLTPPAP